MTLGQQDASRVQERLPGYKLAQQLLVPACIVSKSTHAHAARARLFAAATSASALPTLLALGFLAITAVTLVGTDASHAATFCYNKNTGAFAH